MVSNIELSDGWRRRWEKEKNTQPNRTELNGFENHKKWINALEIYLLLLCDVVVNRFRCAAHSIVWLKCLCHVPLFVFSMYKFTIRSFHSCCFIFGTFFCRYFFGACLLNLHCFAFVFPSAIAIATAGVWFAFKIWCDNIRRKHYFIYFGWLTDWLIGSLVNIAYTHGWWLMVWSYISMDDAFCFAVR